MNDPFPEEGENANNHLETDDTNWQYQASIEAGDNYHSLREAKQSPDWPEWEKAIKTELDQLNQMGTWHLVEKPQGAVPIANKWVFTKKRNKEGQLTKYKV